MDTFDAMLLGLFQGLTEFLPVSSTGHLVLAREFFNITETYGLTLDAVLHFATALAVLLYFRNDLLEIAQSFALMLQGKTVERAQAMLIYALLLGTIPAVVLGLLLEGAIETVFRKPELIAVVLIAGSVLFVAAEYVAKRNERSVEITSRNGLYVGFFQALALFPGMSRSGATISGGMLLGFTREQAARFAFLLSLPIIVGAGSKKLLELGISTLATEEMLTIALGAVVAFLSGLACIHFLMKFLRNHTLYPFVIYRVGLAILILTLL